SGGWMSGEALDLRRSAQIIRRHKALVGIAAAFGLLAGVAYTVLNPPVYTSSALVSISPSVDRASQTTVVTSAPVVSLALPGMGPGVSLDASQPAVEPARGGPLFGPMRAPGTPPPRGVAAPTAFPRSCAAYASPAANLAGQIPAKVPPPAPPATGPALSRWFY